MVKSIEYRGQIFRRHRGRIYYTRGPVALHRKVWEDANGPIPPGFHIHHRDHDSDNNELANLELVEESKHCSHHRQERLSTGGDLAAKLAEWRASSEGKETLRENAQKMRDRTPLRKFACANCGVPVETRHPLQQCCAESCTLQLREKSQMQACEICGEEFPRKKGKRAARTCGYKCGWELRRRASIQSDD